MKNTLTLNLDKIQKESFFTLNPKTVIDSLEKNIVIKADEQKKIMQSSWTTTSSKIRNFIEDTFGICFSADKTDHYSHRRNQLNIAIKNAKSGNTTRGKKSTINFYEYCKLITSDEFIKFITINLQKDQLVKDEKKMYEELMYLQINKYQQSSLYIQKKIRNYNSISFALGLITNIYPYNKNLAEQIKFFYCVFFEFLEDNINYHQEPLTNEHLIILDIISYRFNQSDIKIYKFNSIDDIQTTNDEQIIKFFIQDIDRWDNEITNGNLS